MSDLERSGHRLHDGGVGGRLVEAGVDGTPERREPGEQRRPLEQCLALAGERQRGRDPIADDDHRVAIRAVEATVVAGRSRR